MSLMSEDYNTVNREYRLEEWQDEPKKDEKRGVDIVIARIINGDAEIVLFSSPVFGTQDLI
jgi:hypothetical protein